MVDVFAMDAEAARAARAAGAQVVPGPPDADLLQRVDALVLSPDELPRLADWRTAGHQTPAVVLGYGETPPLPRTHWADADTLAGVLQRLATDRSLRRLPLPMGVAHLDRLRLVSEDGEKKLSQREADLLLHLARNADREVSREEVQTEVFGHARAVATRAVDMAISRLRKKIELDPKAPTALLTSRGGGYRLVLTVRDEGGLVGRGPLLADLMGRLGPGVLTLKGPPGVGKTRLAEAVLDRRSGRFVRLAEVADDDLVRVAVARSLETNEPGQDALLDALERLDGPLVLDNAEHVVNGVRAFLEDVMAELPELVVLVTSQRALEQAFETVVEVPPLSPNDARRLLLETASRPPTTEELDALLPALEGLPLAIELAAGWSDVVPWSTVPDVLGGGLSDRLGAAWQLLDAEHQDALQQLACFAGGIPVEDVLAVLPNPRVLKRLLSASLLQREATHYRVLDPVRRFVSGQGGEPRFQEVHAHRMAVVAEAAVRGGRRASERLGDFDVAWRFRRDPWIGLALVDIHRTHGGAETCRSLLREILACSGDGDVRLRVRLAEVFLHPAQEMQERMDRVDAALPDAQDAQLIGRALAELAWARYRKSRDIEPARRAHAHATDHGLDDVRRFADFLLSSQRVRQQGHALRDVLPTWEGIAADLEALGNLPFALRIAGSVASTWASMGDPVRARLATDTLDRLLGLHPDGYFLGLLHNLRAYEHLDAGAFDEALDAFDAMRRLRFGRRGIPDAVWVKNRAMVLLDAGRTEEAVRDLEDAVGRLEHLPAIQTATVALLGMALLDAGRFDRALQVLDEGRPSDDVTAVSQAYWAETRAVALALVGRTTEANALHATLDPEALGPESAASMWAFRWALGHPDALQRARHDSPTLKSTRQTALLAASPEEWPAFARGDAPTPALVRVCARLLVAEHPPVTPR